MPVSYEFSGYLVEDILFTIKELMSPFPGFRQLLLDPEYFRNHILCRRHVARLFEEKILPKFVNNSIRLWNTPGI